MIMTNNWHQVHQTLNFKDDYDDFLPNSNWNGRKIEFFIFFFYFRRAITFIEASGTKSRRYFGSFSTQL